MVMLGACFSRGNALSNVFMLAHEFLCSFLTGFSEEFAPCQLDASNFTSSIADWLEFLSNRLKEGGRVEAFLSNSLDSMSLSRLFLKNLKFLTAFFLQSIAGLLYSTASVYEQK